MNQWTNWTLDQWGWTIICPNNGRWGRSVWEICPETFFVLCHKKLCRNVTTKQNRWKKKCKRSYRRQTFSVVLLLSSWGWIQIHSSNNGDGTSLSAFCLSAHMTILRSVALYVAATAIVVLLGSVVHILWLPVLLWDAVLCAGQLAIVRHWTGSGATCPLPGHYRKGRITGKGWRVWCCWSYQGGFWGTGVCDRWSSRGWDLITFEKRISD